jgi:hypothetical protein
VMDILLNAYAQNVIQLLLIRILQNTHLTTSMPDIGSQIVMLKWTEIIVLIYKMTFNIDISEIFN